MLLTKDIYIKQESPCYALIYNQKKFINRDEMLPKGDNSNKNDVTSNSINSKCFSITFIDCLSIYWGSWIYVTSSHMCFILKSVHINLRKSKERPESLSFIFILWYRYLNYYIFMSFPYEMLICIFMNEWVSHCERFCTFTIWA